MSRIYETTIETSEALTEETIKALEEKHTEVLEDNNEYVYDKHYVYTYEGNLCGGESEEEAHKRISECIKSLQKNCKVSTKWTYLEELPFESYGDSW